MVRQDRDGSRVNTLLAARPGWWCSAVEAYLRAIPQLQVAMAPATLDDMLATLTRCSIQTLVLEATFCAPHLASTLVCLRNRHPDLNIVIIADTWGEYQSAMQTGSVHVLMKSNLAGLLDPVLFIQPLRAKGPSSTDDHDLW